ncbi:MAG: hypothetical protein J4N63_10505, partial [Chloroflexi bacterium]|nr:hypothetical protein [Chloroflexota bacterium]
HLNPRQGQCWPARYVILTWIPIATSSNSSQRQLFTLAVFANTISSDNMTALMGNLLLKTVNNLYGNYS